jgi:hypothetical protein
VPANTAMKGVTAKLLTDRVRELAAQHRWSSTSQLTAVLTKLKRSGLMPSMFNFDEALDMSTVSMIIVADWGGSVGPMKTGVASQCLSTRDSAAVADFVAFVDEVVGASSSFRSNLPCQCGSVACADLSTRSGLR